jgi:hypothetical protein
VDPEQFFFYQRFSPDPVKKVPLYCFFLNRYGTGSFFCDVQVRSGVDSLVASHESLKELEAEVKIQVEAIRQANCVGDKQKL